MKTFTFDIAGEHFVDVPATLARLVAIGAMTQQMNRESMDSGMPWFCRHSTTGRGMRLHQHPIATPLGNGHATPAEALADHFDLDLSMFGE